MGNIEELQVLKEKCSFAKQASIILVGSLILSNSINSVAELVTYQIGVSHGLEQVVVNNRTIWQVPRLGREPVAPLSFQPVHHEPSAAELYPPSFRLRLSSREALRGILPGLERASHGV